MRRCRVLVRYEVVVERRQAGASKGSVSPPKTIVIETRWPRPAGHTFETFTASCPAGPTTPPSIVIPWSLGQRWDNTAMHAPQPMSPRARLQDLLAIPESQRTD